MRSRLGIGVGRKLLLAAGLWMAAALPLSCAKTEQFLYDSKAIATSFAGLSGENLLDILGPTIIDGGINFAVYSENATRMELLIFEDPESSLPTMRYPLERQPNTNVWTTFVYGIGVGTYYGYIAWGPNWPYREDFVPGTSIGFVTDCDAQGNRFNPNKLLIDPYALRTHSDFNWGKGSPASGHSREISSWGAASKSVVIQSQYQWSSNEGLWRQKRQDKTLEGHQEQDLILYEVHPKGFTKAALGISSPGTWRGIGEMATYLKDLGITAVELLPVAEKPDDGTYWGYNNLNFFIPEQRLGIYNPSEMHSVLDEFKWMVDQLHQHDIEVILDVVYNHSGEGGFWRSKIQGSGDDYGKQSSYDDNTAANIYVFRGLDNQAYYTLDPNNRCARFDRETGVGNQMRSNHVPFRRMIIDSLRFWVEEMHVDGFRFDLAPELGVPDDDIFINTGAFRQKVSKTVLQDIVDDPVLKKHNTRLIAEPWSIHLHVQGQFPSAQEGEQAWGEWNDQFRDSMRQMVNGDEARMNHIPGRPQDFLSALTGNKERYGALDAKKKPYHSVNFVTAHDGFTLYDLVSYAQKQNGCGMVNPVCCANPYDSFCDPSSGDDHNISRDWCPNGRQGSGVCWKEEEEAVKRQMIRNFFTFLLLSHGSPMILGGDEYMRTQLGNNNAYSDSSDNAYNWYRWGDYLTNPAAVRMHDFVRKLIQIRKSYPTAFKPREYQTMQWRNANNQPASGEDYSKRHIGVYYPSANGEAALYWLINMEPAQSIKFSLPQGSWEPIVDTQFYYDHGSYLISNNPNESHNASLSPTSTVTGSYEVKSRTVVLLRQK